MTAYQLAGSPIEEWRRSLSPSQTFRYIKRVHCAWSDRDTVANTLWASKVKGYPCRSIRISPYGEEGAVQPIQSDGSYEKALVIAEYGPLDYEESENYYAFKERLQPAWEAMSIEGHNLIWEDGVPVALSQRPTVYWPFAVYEFEAVGLTPPVCPPLGYVNSGAFTTVYLGQFWSAGKVRYDGCTAESSFHQAGAPRFSYVHHFKIHPYHWDYSWREDGKWLRFADPNTGNPIEKYPKTSLVFF